MTDIFIGALKPYADKHAARHEARLSAFAPAELRALLSFLAFMRESHPLDYSVSPEKEAIASLEKAITACLKDK